MAYETLVYEERGPVAWVTLNRSEKNNAISTAMRHDFRALVDNLYDNEAVRVVVVTGAGKAFSVGADVEHFTRDWLTPAFRASTRLLTNFYNDLEALEKPVIAAINGTCAGGGLEFALSCDIRLAAESARFGLPENNLGLIPGTGGCSRLVRQVGLGKAKEWVLTGRIFSAAEAERAGLINEVAPDDRLAARAEELATALAERAPQALGLAKRVLNQCTSIDLQSGRVIESFAQSILLKTEDHKEGVAAFREKRPRRFQGR